MGLYNDFIDHNVVIGGAGPDRTAARDLQHLKERFDPPAPVACEAKDAVQEIDSFGAMTAGTYRLKFGAFQTAPLAYDAGAATIETAIDTAATAASYPDWTNGDISVSGGPLTTNDVEVTFDGNSVKEQRWSEVELEDIDLVGVGVPSEAEITLADANTLSFTATVNTPDLDGYNFILQDGFAPMVEFVDPDFTLSFTSTGQNSWAQIFAEDVTLDFTAVAVGPGDDGIKFELSSNAAPDVSYDGVDTYTLEFEPGVTTGQNMANLVNAYMGANPGDPQFVASTVVGAGDVLVAGDDGLDATTMGGYDITETIDLEGEFNATMSMHPEWPQFTCNTSAPAALDAADDARNATSANGVEPGEVHQPKIEEPGQPQRYTWALLVAMGIVDPAQVPLHGDDLARDFKFNTGPGDNSNWPSLSLQRFLCWQAAIDDDNPTTEARLKKLFHIQ